MQYKSPISSIWLCAASLRVALAEFFQGLSQKILYTASHSLFRTKWFQVPSTGDVSIAMEASRDYGLSQQEADDAAEGSTACSWRLARGSDAIEHSKGRRGSDGLCISDHVI
jgi:hypothetical protein